MTDVIMVSPLVPDTTSGRHFSHFLVRCLTTIVRLVRHLQWAWLVQEAEEFHNACRKSKTGPGVELQHAALDGQKATVYKTGYRQSVGGVEIKR